MVDGLSITGWMSIPRRRLIPLFALLAPALLFAIPVLTANAAVDSVDRITSVLRVIGQ